MGSNLPTVQAGFATPVSGPFQNPNPYVPATLSEINDQLGSMILWAPRFTREHDPIPGRNIDTVFWALTKSFGNVRKKLGEDRYEKLMDLAARAKALFANDPDDDNGKTDEGRALLYEIEGEIQAVRRRRAAAKEKDNEGEVTGD